MVIMDIMAAGSTTAGVASIVAGVAERVVATVIIAGITKVL